MSSTTEEALERGAVNETEVRSDFERAVLEDGRPLAQIAPETPVAYATLSAWRTGKYAGNNERVSGLVAQWLTTRAARQRTRTVLPLAPDFKMTPLAGRIFDILEHAQTLPDMVLLTGGAGVGKTSAIEAYRKQASNVFISTIEPCINSSKVLLDALCSAVGLTRQQSGLAASQQIKKKLQNSAGLLVLDEAQHLSSALLDQVRHLHDSANVGIALVGNTTVYGRLGAEQRTAQFAQLFSRIGMRINLEKPRKGDVTMLLNAWGLEDKDARELAMGIAMKPGALRVMTKVLRMAGGLASLAAREKPSVQDIQDAWMQLTQSGREAA